MTYLDPGGQLFACDEPIELVRDLVTRDRHEQITATRLARTSKGVLGALAELQLEDIVATRRQVQERHGRVIRAAAPRVAHRHRRKGRIVSHTAGHQVRRQTIKEGMYSLHGRRIEVESVGDEDTMGVKEVAARCVTHEGTLRVGIVQQEQPTKLVEEYVEKITRGGSRGARGCGAAFSRISSSKTRTFTCLTTSKRLKRSRTSHRRSRVARAVTCGKRRIRWRQ